MADAAIAILTGAVAVAVSVAVAIAVLRISPMLHSGLQFTKTENVRTQFDCKQYHAKLISVSEV